MEDPSSPFRKRVKLGEAREIEMEEVPLLRIPKSSKSTNLVSYKSPKTSPMLFPEIWDKILRYLSLTDYLAVINTCSEWNHLLNTRKTTELIQMALPCIMLFLLKKDFLNLRLVCRDWKQKCEFVYQNHPSRLTAPISDVQFPNLSSHGKMLLSVDSGVKLQTIESIKRFTSEMRNDSRNPFPGRCVWLVVMDREDSDSNDENLDEEDEDIDLQFQQEYWNTLNQFLLQFGDHIWYLRLDYFFRFTTNVEERLRNLLLQVPNLKSLRLKLGDPNSDCWTDSSVQLSKRAVKSYRASPPPKLGSLETFSNISSDENLDYFDDFVNQIVKSYCVEGKLKRLHIPDTSYKPKPFPNLKELSALVCYRDLPKLKKASPKLESLCIILQFEDGIIYANEYQEDDWNEYDEFDHNIGVVFKGLHLFADTLKELNVSYEPVTSNEKTKNFKVVLPNLEKLCISYSLPILHLLELKSLRHLEIDESLIFQDIKYCSGIFEQLPKLEKIVHTDENKRRVVLRPL